MRVVTLRATWAVAGLVLFGSGAVVAQERRPITPADYGQWETLGSNSLSPNGHWLAYAVDRQDGENELRVHDLSADTTAVIAYGSRPQFSSDSRWLAYGIGFSQQERERRIRTNSPARMKLGLADLARGEVVVIEEVADYSFSADGAYLAMRRYAPQGRGSRGVDLVVRDLASGVETSFGNIASFAWAGDGALLAMTVDAEGQAGNGVHLFNPATGVLRVLDSEPAAYTGLVWREDAHDLAVMRKQEDDAHEAATHVVIAWRALSGRNPRTYSFDPTDREGFPADTRIVEHRTPVWADDGSAIFFGVQEWHRKEPEPAVVASDDDLGADAGARTEDTSAEEGEPDEVAAERAEPDGDDELPGVEVWHSRDVDIIPEQKLRAQRDREANFLAAWHLNNDRFVQLADEQIRDVNLADGQRWAIGTDRSVHNRDRMFGPIYQDVYRIDVRTAERELIRERVQHTFGPSPGGRYFLYLEGDAYWSYDLERGTHTNLTHDLPTSFVNLDNDHTTEQKPPYGVAAWVKGDRAVLLHDKYDIWEVRPDGSRATRLTRGAEDRVRHRYAWLSTDAREIEPSEPFYMAVFGEQTKRSGYARLRLGREPERLIFEDEAIGRLTKADDAPVYVFTRQAFDVSPNYWVGGPDLADARRVTDTNPFQADFAWGRAELIAFQNAHGRPLHGALYYPADYEPGKQYPMIVEIYEIVSNQIHNYAVPSERTPYNKAVFTGEGYFVFQPDIVYRDRNPGLSALEAVVPAVEKVIETGMIDPDRIGLVGHSWGGYQTAFLVTQTDLFAAAVAGAPLTNLTSMYLSILWNAGVTNAWMFEVHQGRMEVPFWNDLDAYVANSPVFHIEQMNTPLLVAFGDEDGAVDWQQGIEMYNAARRAGKDMVLLVYEGENHSLSRRPNQRDYHRRILEWFGHYLKGDEPARWITEGMPFLQTERELKRRANRRQTNDR